jgi:hypothetical protein
MAERPAEKGLAGWGREDGSWCREQEGRDGGHWRGTSEGRSAAVRVQGCWQPSQPAGAHAGWDLHQPNQEAPGVVGPGQVAGEGTELEGPWEVVLDAAEGTILGRCGCPVSSQSRV